MTIVYDDKFTWKFDTLWRYIAQDSKNRANQFKQELREHIENISHFPYKFRRSKWFDNDDIRDLIFKGYTIPYVIQKDRIVILDIFKWTDH